MVYADRGFEPLPRGGMISRGDEIPVVARQQIRITHADRSFAAMGGISLLIIGSITLVPASFVRCFIGSSLSTNHADDEPAPR